MKAHAIRLVLALLAVTLGACGGPQAPATRAGPSTPRERCVDGLWEQPPTDIGQTPPDVQAPAGVLAPFDGDGSGR